MPSIDESSMAQDSSDYGMEGQEGVYLDGHAFTEHENDGEMDEDDVPVYCICRKPEGGFMICCEVCGEWYHGRCIGIEREMGERLPHFTCHTCNNGTSTRFWSFLQSSHILAFLPL